MRDQQDTDSDITKHSRIMGSISDFWSFFVLIIVAYLMDIKIWRNDKTHLNEEYQIDSADDEKCKDDNIDTYLRKFATEMEFENNM
ncbi:hypothetical protein WUBG_16676, partial [Wuchereria bancrofti]